MNNFGRALRLSLRYPFTLTASVVCAVAVALFWGGNISAVYPLVEVTTKGRSLQVWAKEGIEQSALRADEIRRDLKQLDRQLAAGGDQHEKLTKEKVHLLSQLHDQDKNHARYRWLLRYVIDPFLPDDPFLTLTLVVGLLLAGTVIKSLFFVFHQILVARLSQHVTFLLRKQFYRRTLRLDLATFGNEGTSELMSRFTYDMESLSYGMNDFFGKLIREPLKMLTCLVGAACVCWQLLLLSLVLAPL